MKKIAIVIIVIIALTTYVLLTRVKMQVEYPATPGAENSASEPQKEDPPLIQSLRTSIKSPENDAAISAQLKNGADANAVDAKGRSALYWAIANGDLASIQALLQAGADVNKSDLEMQWTPLMHASYQAARDEKFMPTVKLLIEKGAGVNSANPQGFTALHVAITNSKEKGPGPELVDFLLRNGANPNAEAASSENVPGITPLMDAAREGKISLAKLLVKAGAKLDTKGPNGKTPSELANEHGHPELAQALAVAAVVEKPKIKKKAK